MSSKANRHKLYGSMQEFIFSTHKLKDLSMDCIRGLLKGKNWRQIKCDSIFVIFDRLIKIVHYGLIPTDLDAEKLVHVLI